VKQDDSGAIAIVVALFAVVLFGFAALVVDVGNAADVKAQASTAADAGALAGARTLASLANTNPETVPSALEAAVYDEVTSTVDRTFPVTDSQWAVPASCAPDPSMPPGLTPLPSTSCIQYSATSMTVWVRIPARHVPSTFGGLFGASSIGVSPVSAATAGQDPLPPCEPCVPKLGDTGQPTPPLPSYSLEPPLDSPAPPFAEPDPATQCPLEPGEYENDVTPTADCTLTPGVYVFDGTLTIDNPWKFTTLGATLIFKGTGTLQSEGHLVLSAPSSGPTKDLAILIESRPSSADPASRFFELGDNFSITGNLYALAGTIWHTDPQDCLPSGGTCELNGVGSEPGVLAVSATSFGSDPFRVPTVHTTPARPPQPGPEHLVE
jgi:hypothetical protein